MRAHLLERAADSGDLTLRRVLQHAARPRRHAAASVSPPRMAGAQSQTELPPPDRPIRTQPPQGAVERDEPPSSPGTILQAREVTDRLRVLRLAKPEGFHFEPGQHVRLSTQGVSRPYTLVSAPHEPFLEVFVQRADQGKLTPHLWRLTAGDRIDLRGPAKGGLRLDTAFRRHLMIATASGIAPFISMLRHVLHAGTNEHVFHLLHGVRYQDELGYAEELKRMPSDRAHYLPTVSQPDDPRNRGWPGAHGRVESHLEPTLRAHGMRPEDTAIYACGNPGMVENVKTALAPRGFRVHTEPF